MAILFHGTTFYRAKLIVQKGPDLAYRQGGSQSYGSGDFSACLAHGPFKSVGCPEWYAWAKADTYKTEEGPALLIMDIPDELIALTTESGWSDPKYGFVQFDQDAGIGQLRADWHIVRKRIIRLSIRPPFPIPTY